MTDENDMDYENLTLIEMAKTLQALRDRHTELKEQAATLWREVDHLRMTLIPQKMEELGIETTVITGVGRLSVRDEMSVKTLDKTQLMWWLRDNNHADLMSNTVNSSTLKAFIREQIATGEPIPADTIISINTFQMATITKG